MGADLITAIAFKQRGSDLNLDAGLAVIDTLTYEELAGSYTADTYYAGEVPGPEDKDAVLQDLRSYLKVAAGEVVDMWAGMWRLANIYSNVPPGLDMLVVGDTSWGDSIQVVDLLVAVSEFDDLYKAMGMIFIDE